MMHWKTFQPLKATNDFVFLIWSLFLSIWPNIITNWLSDIAGRWLNIETSAGAWSVMVATVASILMYWIWRRRTKPNGPYSTPDKSDSNAKYFLMQGGMFSLALALSQACQGVYNGPMTDDQIMPIVVALIPALEGAFGSQFIHILNNQALYYLDISLKELIARHPRVTERMILERAKALSKAHHIEPFASISETEVKQLIRSRMVQLATGGEANQHIKPGQRFSIDSFSDPNVWRIDKKEIVPVKPVDTVSNVVSSEAAKLLEMQTIEKEQQKIWQQWRTDITDHEALYDLSRQAFHTKHGLMSSIKLDIALWMINILTSITSKDRKMTKDEHYIIGLLEKLLGEPHT
jgi:hypothetical protein